MKTMGYTPAHRVLETTAAYTHLGIRFWDPALDQEIGDGLTVTARLEDAPRPVAAAFRTYSDVYAFRALPGMRALETTTPGGGPTRAGPLKRYVYIVEVHDARRRYADVGFRVTLPLSYRGVYLLDPSCSPSAPAPKGLSLYSAVTRGAVPMLASIRGELWDVQSDRPASFAVACINTGDGYRWHGLADEAGRCLVMFPHPNLSGGIGDSSSAGQRKPIWERTWDVEVEVRYEPSEVRALPDSVLKDYLSVLTQAPGQVWAESPDNGGNSSASLRVVLGHEKQQILRTAGSTRLLVSPAASPL